MCENSSRRSSKTRICRATFSSSPWWKSHGPVRLSPRAAGTAKLLGGGGIRRAVRLPLGWVLIVLAGLTACGKVADPKPPDRPLTAIRDLSLGSGANPTLEFSLPGEEARAVEVMVFCGPGQPGAEDFKLMARITRSRLIPSPRRDRFEFVIGDQVRPPCHFVARIVDAEGRKSTFSNPVMLP